MTTNELSNIRAVNAIKGVIAIISFWYFLNAFNAFMNYIRDVTFSEVAQRYIITWGLEIVITVGVVLWIGWSFIPPENRPRFKIERG